MILVPDATAAHTQQGRARAAGASASAKWQKATRAEPLWRPGSRALHRVRQIAGGGPDGGRRFFDERGAPLIGPNAQFGLGASILGVSAAVADREESERPYEENVWVRAALKAIAHGFQRLGFELWQGEPGEDGSQLVERHVLYDWLQRPNRVLSRRKLWHAHAVNMKHDGEEVWFLANAQGEPVATNSAGALTEPVAQIIPVRGDLVEVQNDALGMPEKYRYSTAFSSQGGAGGPSFPAEAVVHFRDYDPYNITRGLGDVDGLVRETDLYFQAFRAMDGSVRNAGDPGGFIIFNHPVDPGEMQRRQDEADESFAGPNARRYKLLDAAAKFTPNTVVPKDMQYRELVEWLRDSILAGLGVPPPVVGVYDSATYNNVETAHRELWTGANGILSLASLAADTIESDLLPRLERLAPGSSELTVHFNHSAIQALQDDISEKLEKAAEIAARGIAISFNEGLAMQGVEVEAPAEGDRRWVAETLTDLDDPDAGKREMPSVDGSGDAGGEGGKEATSDEDSATDPDSDDDGETQRADVPHFLTFAADRPPFDPEIRARVLKWLGAFETHALAHLRKIANGGLRRYGDFDDIVDPRTLTPEQLESLVPSHAEWSERLGRDVRVPLRDVFQEALTAAHSEVGGTLLTVTHPDVIERLGKQVMQLREGVTSVTTRRVRNAISKVLEGVTEPGSLRRVLKDALPELTEELKRVFGTKDNRAATIAQTETGKAENGAKITQYEHSGVTQIQWVASQDEAVRATHLAVHGTVVELGGFFANGLRHPHDPDAPASEVVNCRCEPRPYGRVNPLSEIDG